jgi:hypothetical protein
MTSKPVRISRSCRSLAACGIALALALSGCGLIQDTLGLSPPPGAMTLDIQGPANTEIAVTVSGADFSNRFTDDGTGFRTSLSLRPGMYTIRAVPQTGFAAQVSITQKNGNSTRLNEQTVNLESNALTGVRISYVSVKP